MENKVLQEVVKNQINLSTGVSQMIENGFAIGDIDSKLSMISILINSYENVDLLTSSQLDNINLIYAKVMIW